MKMSWSPAGMRWSTAHSIGRQYAGEQRHAGLPGGQSRPPKRSWPLRAKRSERARWSSANTLIPKYVGGAKRLDQATAWPRQMSTSGGSSETEVNEFTVRPCGAPLAVDHAGDRDPGCEASAGAPEIVARDRRGRPPELLA